MLQVLLRIPLNISLGGKTIPLFGPAGLVEALWVLPWLVLLVVRFVRGRRGADTLRMVATAAVGAVAIALVPRFAPEGIPIYGYGTMMFLAFLAAAWISSSRARSSGIDPNDVWDVAMWVFVAGVVGARLFFVIQYHDQFQSFGEVLNITKGGLVYYGGVIAAVLTFAVYVRLKGIPALALCDILAPGVAIGLAFGRVGCFLNGCCYGDETALPWAVHFPAGSVPFDAMVARGLLDDSAAHTPGLHPTQLYSALNGLVLCLLLLAYYPWRRRAGQVIALLLVVYPFTRFLIEELRADERALATGLTISQNISVLLMLAGIALWSWLQTHPETRQRRVGRARAPARNA